MSRRDHYPRLSPSSTAQSRTTESTELKWIGKSWMALGAVAGLLVLLGVTNQAATSADRRLDFLNEKVMGLQSALAVQSASPRREVGTAVSKPGYSMATEQTARGQLSNESLSKITASTPPTTSKDDPRSATSSPLSIIKTPNSGTSVSANFATVEGELPPIDADYWIVVVPERSPSLAWPQALNPRRGIAMRREGNHFSVPAYFGGERPQDYDVALLSVSANLAKIFRDNLRRGTYTNKHEGIDVDAIQLGSKEIDRVRIHGVK
jgi:hypothetical protein